MGSPRRWYAFDSYDLPTGPTRGYAIARNALAGLGFERTPPAHDPAIITELCEDGWAWVSDAHDEIVAHIDGGSYRLRWLTGAPT